MKYTAIKKPILMLCGMAMMLALWAGIVPVPVHAAANGIYTATATPHYRNPSTGAIEDSGGEGSEALGQSMTESATYGTALVEVDASGNTWITVRLQLMDNIQNPQFQVDGSSVSATLMQEDYGNNTADYRMKVNSENSIIRCNMYVTAMGRDVVFFITVSGLTSGSGDFITSITVEQPPAEQPAAEQQSSAGTQSSGNTQSSGSTQSNGDSQNSGSAQNSGNTADSEGTQDAGAVQNTGDSEATQDTQEQGENAAEESKETTSLTESKKAKGIEEYDSDGNKVENTAKKTEKDSAENTDKETGADSKTEGKNHSVVVAVVIIVVIAVIGIGAGIWYYKFYKKSGGREDEK